MTGNRSADPSDASANRQLSGPQQQLLGTIGAAGRQRVSQAQPARPQWVEPSQPAFTRGQRASTSILLGGLTPAHDRFLTATLGPLGYSVQTLPPPDNEALHIGKAYCDRAMCNPAYYVVGNLVRHLAKLRDVDGQSTGTILKRYLSVTANGCGPCRYGLYTGQYRKALREAGFEGFRVIEFSQSPDAQRTGEAQGLDVNASLLFHVAIALILGDVVNLLKHRVRPYEREGGATDAAVTRSCVLIRDALAHRHGLLPALLKVRREFASVAVDRTRVKPKAAIIGEIWAQTTEGEGNYRLPSFLEEEGAEVETQPMTVWVLSRFWEPRYDLLRMWRLSSGQRASGQTNAPGIWWKVPALLAGEGLVRLVFNLVAWLAGLRGYRLPSIAKMSRASAPYYDPNQKGGEMFMEVGKMLQYSAHSGANLVVSVKPFGCMPSSAVSDGIQSLIAERHPETQFLSIETTGDGEVNVHSRLQMQLFKATEAARGEAQRALSAGGLTLEEVRDYLNRNPRLNRSLQHDAGRFACGAANLFERIGHAPRFQLRRLWRAGMARTE